MTKYGEQRDSPAVTAEAEASSSTATKRFWTPGRYNFILHSSFIGDDDDNDFSLSLTI